jgi:hypothetical protein
MTLKVNKTVLYYSNVKNFRVSFLNCAENMWGFGAKSANHVVPGSTVVTNRVSYETSFDSKQPKMEPKLVSTLSETRHLFRLFRFNIETACFGVSIEPKQ